MCLIYFEKVKNVELLDESKIKLLLYSTTPTVIEHCRRVFQSLVTLAVEELCEMANSQIAPVQMGVARPTASFPLLPSSTDATAGSEELFSVEPLLPYSSNSILEHDQMSMSENSNHGGGRQLEVESHPIQILSDARLIRAADFGHDQEVEGDQDVEDSMDEQHDQDVNDHDMGDGDADERDRIRVAEPEAMALGEAGEQESDMELDLLAESESDSDDNQSNLNDAASSVAQRSIQTHATAGSDTGGGVANLALFSEDDSDDSTQQEDDDEDEDESEANDSDDRDTTVAGTSGATTTAGTVGTASASAAGGAASAASNSVGGVDEFAIANEEQVFERRLPSSTQRGNLAPVSMQWAIRSRENTNVRTGTTSGLVFIDHTSGTMRRSATTTAVAAAAAAAANNQEAVTMANTASGLARAFGIIMREVGDLLKFIQDYPNSSQRLARKLDVTQEDVNKLQMHLDRRLLKVWEWLLTVMDSTESQLKFGASLTTYDSGNSGAASALSQVARIRTTTTTTTNAWTRTGLSSDGRSIREREDAINARREFLSYSLSLMRAHNTEHLDSLPVIDVSSLKHVAYVFDSLIYFLRSGSDTLGPTTTMKAEATTELDSLIVHDPEEPDDMTFTAAAQPTVGTAELAELDDEISQTTSGSGKTGGKRHTFFQRSQSTLCLGCLPPDPFQTVVGESLPLAEKPHLLQPNVRREEMFGCSKLTENSALKEIKPLHLGLTSRSEDPPSFAALLEKRSKASETNPDMDCTDSTADFGREADVIAVKIEEVEHGSKQQMELLKSGESLLPPTASTPAVILTKPPPLVRISSSESGSIQSSSSTLQAGSSVTVPKWGSPQSVPQDLSIGPRIEDEGILGMSSGTSPNSNIQRAPIIVSVKKLSSPVQQPPIPCSSSMSQLSVGDNLMDPGLGRSPTKSVIVCNRHATSIAVS